MSHARPSPSHHETGERFPSLDPHHLCRPARRSGLRASASLAKPHSRRKHLRERQHTPVHHAVFARRRGFGQRLRHRQNHGLGARFPASLLSPLLLHRKRTMKPTQRSALTGAEPLADLRPAWGAFPGSRMRRGPSNGQTRPGRKLDRHTSANHASLPLKVCRCSYVRLPSALRSSRRNTHAKPAPLRLRRLSFPVARAGFSPSAAEAALSLLSGLYAFPPQGGERKAPSP